MQLELDCSADGIVTGRCLEGVYKTIVFPGSMELNQYLELLIERTQLSSTDFDISGSR